MEAADSGKRHSGIASLIHHDQNSEVPSRTYTSAPSMAAAAVISPPSMYSGGQGPMPPYPSSWPAPPSQPMSALVSPQEPRRMLDKVETPGLQATAQRQSLPSIHEALNHSPKPIQYTSSIPPASHSQHYPLSSTPGSALARPYSESASYQAPAPSRNSPPLSAHRTSTFPRSDPAPPSYPEPRHSTAASLQTAPAPPHNPYAAPGPPRFDAPMARYEQDSRAPGRPPPPPPPPPPPTAHVNHPPQYIYPTSAPSSSDSGYASSQVGAGSTAQPPRYQSRDGRNSGDWGRSSTEGKQHPFTSAMKRQLDIWDFENNLALVNSGATVLRNWSAHYGTIAQEQQRTTSIPERMPSLEDCNEMLAQNAKVQEALQYMKQTIYQQEHALADQRMREQSGKDYDGDDLSMYGDDNMKGQGFTGSEAKKRRGRAAHPGRCHSCNRAETPEWRRGPDGARTLCNACGLHYAKLTRKNIMKQSQVASGTGSQLRPKSMDEQ